MKKQKPEVHEKIQITVSASETYSKNSSFFPVISGEYIQVRVPYIGKKGKRFSSLIALIWVRNGIEFSRETRWIEFNGKDRILHLTGKVPEGADKAVIGLRINCETPVKGETALFIQDIESIKIQKTKHRPPRYLRSKIKDDLFPNAFIRGRVRSRRKLLNHILVRFQSLYLKNSWVIGSPLLAFVDPSNLCNYRCPLCPTGRTEKLRPRRLMKFEDFKTIMDQIGKNLYKLNLYNWGEPLLNRDFARMVRYAKRFDVIVESSTNLSILDEDSAEDMIASGLDYLIVAVDGITEESYTKYRIGGSLEKVLDNLNLLINLKKKIKAQNPHLILSFLPNRYNEQDIPKAREFFKETEASFTVGQLRLDMCDEITKTKDDIAPLADWLPRHPDLSVYNENLDKTLSDTCRWPWELITIHPDGSVSPCCAVYSERFDFGNVLDSSFAKVWNGRKYQRARNIIRKKKADQDPRMPCSYCIRRGGFLDYQPTIHYTVL